MGDFMKERINKILKIIKKYRYFIVFVILMLSINTYAWFVYVTRVDTSFTAKVRSWNVMFQVHDNNIANEVVFQIGDLYPGMPAYNDFASIVNTGETPGEIYFDVKRVEILGQSYAQPTYTSAQLVDMLENNYPFSIELSLTNNVVNPGRTELFNIDVTWPYESGNDALDTQWGMQAYQYLNNNNTTTCISITAEVRVNQENLNGENNS